MRVNRVAELAVEFLNGTLTDMTELRSAVEALLEESGGDKGELAHLFENGFSEGEVAARVLSLALRLREQSEM